MGVAADLQRQARSKSGIDLAQINPRLLRQSRQLRPRPFIKASVRGIGEVLFHHRRVNRHAPHAVLVDHPRFAPGRDGLGQQPLNVF